MFIIHIKILHLIIYVNEVQNILMHFLMLIIIPILLLNILLIYLNINFYMVHVIYYYLLHNVVY